MASNQATPTATKSDVENVKPLAAQAEEKDEEEFITLQFAKLSMDPAWTPTEDYFVHIDVLHGCSQKVSSRINSFMLKVDSYDPRRSNNFPTDLLDQGEKDTLKRRTALAGIGDQYYELWKVRKEFSLAEFRVMVGKLPNGASVRIVRIIDNEHDINVYDAN